jgi:acyl-CoA thioesterase FadM
VIEHRISIRFLDTDGLGHVNNAVYFTYLEELLLHWLGPVLGDDFVAAMPRWTSGASCATVVR